MQYRQLGRTDMKVATISFGAWAIGGTWGEVDDSESLKALHRAVDLGVNFIDTADVYGDGRSERLVARLRRERPRDTIFVATKAGRRLPKQETSGYNRENLNAWVDRSLKNLEVDALDLLQLHCPPTDLYDHAEVFGLLDDLVKAGKLRYYGVSVEKVQEALKAITYPNVQTVQIIFNMFRLKPAEEFFDAALRAKVGILARVPLASGMLTGKMSKQYTFSADDHRAFNRNGESFDKGETFSGVPYDLALEAVEELKQIKPAGMTLAQFALRWTLMFDAVTCAIPGAKTPAQEEDNAASADIPAFSADVMAKVKAVYDKYMREIIQPQW
ncbi:MAG: aldo/keto reductase [Anaerolineae bacterium]|nr:aldo/keto reductase [Anaerolineae bacterium]